MQSWLENPRVLRRILAVVFAAAILLGVVIFNTGAGDCGDAIGASGGESFRCNVPADVAMISGVAGLLGLFGVAIWWGADWVARRRASR